MPPKKKAKTKPRPDATAPETAATSSAAAASEVTSGTETAAASSSGQVASSAAAASEATSGTEAATAAASSSGQESEPVAVAQSEPAAAPPSVPDASVPAPAQGASPSPSLDGIPLAEPGATKQPDTVPSELAPEKVVPELQPEAARMEPEAAAAAAAKETANAATVDATMEDTSAAAAAAATEAANATTIDAAMQDANATAAVAAAEVANATTAVAASEGGSATAAAAATADANSPAATPPENASVTAAASTTAEASSTAAAAPEDANATAVAAATEGTDATAAAIPGEGVGAAQASATPAAEASTASTAEASTASTAEAAEAAAPLPESRDGHAPWHSLRRKRQQDNSSQVAVDGNEDQSKRPKTKADGEPAAPVAASAERSTLGPPEEPDSGRQERSQSRDTTIESAKADMKADEKSGHASELKTSAPTSVSDATKAAEQCSAVGGSGPNSLDAPCASATSEQHSINGKAGAGPGERPMCESAAKAAEPGQVDAAESSKRSNPPAPQEEPVPRRSETPPLSVDPRQRLLLKNVPPDASVEEVMYFLNGAILHITNQVETVAKQGTPAKPCVSCEINAKSSLESEAVVAFKTECAASVAMKLDGIQLREASLKVCRPQDYTAPPGGDPHEKLTKNKEHFEVTLAELLDPSYVKQKTSGGERSTDPATRETPRGSDADAPVKPPADHAAEKTAATTTVESGEQDSTKKSVGEPAAAAAAAQQPSNDDTLRGGTAADTGASSKEPAGKKDGPVPQGPAPTMKPDKSESASKEYTSAKETSASQQVPNSAEQSNAGAATQAPGSTQGAAAAPQAAAGQAEQKAQEDAKQPSARAAESTRRPVEVPAEEKLSDNHYEALGIKQKSTVAEIKKAYHTKSRLFHPDKNHHDPHATAKFQRIVEAYNILSSPTKRAQYDATLIMKQACGSLGVTEDPRATAFVQRHSIPGREVQAMQIESRHIQSLLGPAGSKLQQIKSQSGADILVLSGQLSVMAQLLIAGPEPSITQARNLVTACIQEFTGVRAPRDGVVLVVPQQLLSRMPQAAQQFQSIYLQTAAACRFVATDRIVVHGGMRVPQAVATIQWPLEWRATVLMPDGRLLDCWCYAHLCEAAGAAAQPGARISELYAYLLAPSDPDAAAVRRVLSLALGEDPNNVNSKKESLVELVTRTLDVYQQASRHVTGAMMRAASSVAVHAEHAALSIKDGASLLCSFYKIAPVAGASMATRFSTAPLLKTLQALTAALTDAREGLTLRARGFGAVREAVPDDGKFHSWESILPQQPADGPIVIFWNDLRAWVTERRATLGVQPPPMEWLSVPRVMALILSLCVGQQGVFFDAAQGIKRVPLPAAPPVPPSMAQQPVAPVGQQAASAATAPVASNSTAASGQASTADDVSAEEKAQLTLLENVEEVLLTLSGTDAAAYVAICTLTQEAQKRVASNSERLSKKWYESHSSSFELKLFRAEDWRVRLVKEARARASGRVYERDAERLKIREQRIAEEVLPRLSGDNLPRTLRSPELAALLTVVSRANQKVPDKLPSALLRRLCHGGDTTPKALLNDAAPFAPAILMRAIVAMEKARKERWDKDALDIVLQAAALDMHAVEDRPRAALGTAAAALWAAARRPFDERLNASRCLLVPSAALRMQVELAEKVALSEEGSGFRPFAQMCAWLAHLAVTTTLADDVKKDVIQAFKKLGSACEELGKNTESAPCDPEGLCRLAMSIALIVRDDPRSNGFGMEALEGLGRVCVQRALDQDFNWSPQQIAVLASAYAAATVSHDGLFRKVGIIAERHAMLGNEWSNDQLMKLLHSAFQLGQLDKLEGLLKNLQSDQLLSKSIKEATFKDVPVFFAVLVLIKDKKLLEELARGQRDKLHGLSIQGLVKLLEIWPSKESGDGADFNSSTITSFKAAVVRECIGMALRKAPTLAELQVIVTSAAGLGDAKVLAKLGELAAASSSIGMLPSADSSWQELRKIGELLDAFEPASVDVPRLEASAAGRLVLAMERTSPDPRDAAPAVLNITEAAFAQMPGALVAVAEQLARKRLRTGSGDNSSVRQLCERLVRAAAKVTAAPSRGASRTERDRDARSASGDSELDGWVERVERCAMDDGRSSSSSSERRFDWLEKEAGRRVLPAARDALGSSWLASLLMRSRRLTWGGGKVVLLEAPRPRAAARRLAEAASALLSSAVRAEADALQPEAVEKSMPSAPTSRAKSPTAPPRPTAATAGARGSAASGSGPIGSSAHASSSSSAGAPRRAPADDWAKSPDAASDRSRPHDAGTDRARASDAIGASRGGSSGSTPSASSGGRPPPGALIVSGGRDEGMSDTIAGTYMPSSTNHNRGVYQRVDPPTDSKVLLYYWDERDGEANRGWWFGPEVGGEEVWAHNPGVSTGAMPPVRGWVVLHSGEVDPGLTVTRVEAPRSKPVAPSSASSAPAPSSRGATSAPSSDTARGGVTRPGPPPPRAPPMPQSQPQTGPRPRGSVGSAYPASRPAPSSAGAGGQRPLRPTPPPGPPPGRTPAPSSARHAPSHAGGDSGAPPGKRPRYDSAHAEELRQWLEGLDDGVGAMVQYFDVLASEFDADLAQIAAAKVDGGEQNGVLGVVDPSFWDTVRVTKAGHKMLFARGIAKL